MRERSWKGGRGGKKKKRKLAGEGDSLSWVKERKTGSSWEDSLKKKNLESRIEEQEESERSWERGVEKGFLAKGIFKISRCESENIFNRFMNCIDCAIFHFVFLVLVLLELFCLCFI